MSNDDLMPNRQNDLYLMSDPKQMYQVTMTYWQTPNDIRWITKGPMKGTVAIQFIDEMLTALDNGDYVCIRTQFFNPKHVISIKLGLWRDKDDGQYDNDYELD